MTVRTEPLSKTFADIDTAIVNRLADDANLTDVKGVTIGQKKHIGQMASPSLWLIPAPHTPELVGGCTAQHDITFDFVALVREKDPETGLRKAQDLALRVYDSIVEDRTLGGVVDDVRPLRVDPAYDMGESTQLYWSAVQFAFRLKRRE